MVIFIDMDDVLADTYGKHIELYNQEYSKNLTKDEFNGGEVWQNVPEEHQESIHRHVHEPGFFRSLEPIPGSIEVVEALSKKHEVYIASAAMQFPNSLLPPTGPLHIETVGEHTQSRPQTSRGHPRLMNGLNVIIPAYAEELVREHLQLFAQVLTGQESITGISYSHRHRLIETTPLGTVKRS